MLQVWLMYSSTLSFIYCIADFCLPKCLIDVPYTNEISSNEIHSSDFASDTHCFLRLNAQVAQNPIFFKFSNFNATRSFAQVSWNYRGRDKIEELNSFVLDASVQTWKPVVDSGYDSVEGVYLRWLSMMSRIN